MFLSSCFDDKLWNHTAITLFGGDLKFFQKLAPNVRQKLKLENNVFIFKVPSTSASFLLGHKQIVVFLFHYLY